MALGAFPALLMVNLTLSGFNVPLPGLSRPLRFLAAASPCRYTFEAQTGFHPAAAEKPQGPRLFSGRELRQIASRDFAASTTQDAAKALMRAALAPLLGDKPLTSRSMFQRER